MRPTTRRSPLAPVLFALLAVLPLANTRRGQAQPPEPEPQRRALAHEIATAVDSLAVAAIAGGAGPGLGVAVTLDGRVVHLRAYGMADVTRRIPADASTLWYVASTSKSFIGMAVSLLAHEGRLDVNAPITALLPAARWPAGVRADSLTLSQFLAHTMGLTGGAVVTQAAFVGQVPERDWPTLLQWSAPRPVGELVYNNLGYNVAAMVVDRLHADGWRDFVERRLFHPAGMRETFARVSGLDTRRFAQPHDLRADGSFATARFSKVDATMNSAGGHLATLRDLARWTLVQMDSGRLEGAQVLPAAAVARSHTLLARQTRDAARRFAFFDREGWAAGWDLGSYEGERMVSRFGSYHSMRSHLSFLPARRVGVVAQTNGDAGGAVTDIIAALVYDLEAGRPDARARAQARLAQHLTQLPRALAAVAAQDSVRATRQRQPLTRGWRAYAGTFTHPGFGTIVFTDASGGLRFEWGAQHGPVEIYDAARDQLRIEIAGNGTVAQFLMGADGRAERVRINEAELVRR